MNANLAIRLTTAAVVVPVLLGTMFFCPPIWFYGLVLTATVVGGVEFFRMIHSSDALVQTLETIVCALVSLMLYFCSQDARVVMVLLIALPLHALFLVLWRLKPLETAAFRVTAGAFGPAYLGGLTLLALLLKERGLEGPGFVLLTLMIAWFGDTAGYFAGRFLGRRKLYEAVSPNKTIEGALGGLGGSLIGVFFAHFVSLKSLPLGEGVLLGLTAGAFGQAGDLGESLLKRSMGVKDSGGMVPGHGGVLDRADALLVVAPVVYAYTRFRYG